MSTPRCRYSVASTSCGRFGLSFGSAPFASDAPTTRQPWTQLLPDATVDVVEFGAVVRIVAKPGADDPAGRVFQMLLTRDLAVLAGD